jgi:putative FmdB family regulatory protein
MLYDYECSDCKYFMSDVYQSIHDEALTKCPECNKPTLERVIHGGIYANVYQEPTTIGQQSEKNWKNMGHYKRSEIEANADSKAREKRESRKMINRLNTEKQYHYIMTGEVKK